MKSKQAIDRRRLLKSGAAAVGGMALLGNSTRASLRALTSSAAADENVLVVVQLAGGNDGLNTVVPYADDLYHAARDTTRIPAESVLRMDDYRGFNPQLGGLREVWEQGQLGIVEGVGYPNPNRSHFTSFDIWHAASPRGRTAGYGWMTRLAAELESTNRNLAVHIGERLPYSLYSPVQPSVCFRDPMLYRWDRNGEAIEEAARGGMDDGGMEGMKSERRVVDSLRETFTQAKSSSIAIREATSRYKPRAEYPNQPLAHAMRAAAALIQERIGFRILSVELTGFDTHGRQQKKHEDLLATVDGAVSAFLRDLAGTPMADKTLVMVFSEFGRRVAENGSKGTDHGTAGPMFLAGPAVKGGLYGQHPTLSDLDEGDLIFNTDFRSVYSTVIQDWFGVDPTRVLDGTYPTLPCLSS